MSPKRFLYLVATLAMLNIAMPARAADPGVCYIVSNSDARAHCLAKAHGDPGRCYSIQPADLRAQCLAETCDQ